MFQHITEDRQAVDCNSQTDGQQAAVCAADRCFLQ